MKLTIKRDKWLVGESPAASELLRARDGKMCCLGFYCIAKGASKEEILGKAYVAELWKASQRFGEVAGAVSRRLMMANDATWESKGWTMPQREARIAELFKEAGIEVSFV